MVTATAFATVLGVTTTLGCATDSAEDDASLESDNTGGLGEATPEGARIVKLANELSLQDLVDAARLPEIAAVNIDAYRKGDDGEPGTEDDERFESLAELDAIPLVGPEEFRRLRELARAKPEAVITGSLTLPTDAILPAFRVYAIKADGTKYFAYHRKMNGPATYAIAVEPGDYYLVSYVSPDDAVGYTTADHLLARATAAAGSITSGIDVVDRKVKRVPVEPTSPEKFGCAGIAYSGACGDTSAFDRGLGVSQDTVTWCEDNVLRRKTCAVEQKCAWENDGVGFNCVAR